MSANTVKHTPGPWRASSTEPQGDWCIHAPGVPWQLAYLGASSRVDWPLEANARLIAAAPELLAALEDAVEILMTHGYSVNEHMSAILKAHGTSTPEAQS